MIFYPGTMDHALYVSLESLVIDHEICGIANRILNGISVTDEKLGINIIDRVGPGGHYFKQKHTIEFLEEEHYLSKLSDQDSYETRLEKGKRSVLEKSRDLTKKILKEHEPLVIDSALDKEILSIIKEVEKRELC